MRSLPPSGSERQSPRVRKCCASSRRSAAPASDSLDYTAVLTLAATFAQTETGRATVRGLFPFGQAREIAEALDDAAEAMVAAERVRRSALRDLEPPQP